MTRVGDSKSSLAVAHPSLLDTWNPEQNPGVAFDDLTRGSKRQLTWECDEGHLWLASPKSRTRDSGDPGCPVCAGRELRVGVNDIATTHPHLAAEWHPTLNGDLLPDTLTVRSSKEVWWLCAVASHLWKSSPGKRRDSPDCPQCTKTSRTLYTLQSDGSVTSAVAGIPFTHPEMLEEWDYEKNDVLPSEVRVSSTEKVWWLNKTCGHSWRVAPRSRLNGAGCPTCAGKNRDKASLPPDISFAGLYPDLAQEWNYTKNVLKPDQVTPGSGHRVWWTGTTCKHTWIASVKDRVGKQTTCGVCAKRFLVQGTNDLATLYPALAQEWHPSNLSNPENHLPSSPLEVKWIGECGHEWETAISYRVRGGTNCLVCARRNLLVGYNDLSTTHPDVAATWHPAKNGGVEPEEVSVGVHKQFWWLGVCGHEWRATPWSKHTQGCPVCAGKQLLVGYNDLLSCHPNIAAEWHPTKNDGVIPAEVLKGSKKIVWWQCDKGHEWEASVQGRTSRNGSCPRCSTSRAESDIYDFICDILPAVTEVKRDRKVLAGKELDIYIPAKHFAVEFNGLYWHTEEQGKTRMYHLDKYLLCAEKGVQLVQVWEDEWKRNPTQVKRMLAHKLGVPLPGERKIMARKTHAVELSKQQAEEFLSEHHVQGYAAGSYYLGLVESGDIDSLVAVLVLKKEAGTGGKVLNIIRYATSVIVPGGFTKLLKYAEREYQPDSFITFSDHCVSDGGLYRNNGFVADKELPPDYMYLIRGERKHKFGYRLKRFENDPELIWQEGLTERELATLNGLHRIWDAGKTRWVKTLGT